MDTLGRLLGGDADCGPRSHLPCSSNSWSTDQKLGNAIASLSSMDDFYRRSADIGADNTDDRVAAQRKGRTARHGWSDNRLHDRAPNRSRSTTPPSTRPLCGIVVLADEQQTVRAAERVSVGIPSTSRVTGRGVSAGGTISAQTRRSVGAVSH